MIAGSEPTELRRRNAETGVLHAEWIKDALVEEFLERLSRRARDQHAQHVGTRVVHPTFARLVHQRQCAEAVDPGIRSGRRRDVRAYGDSLLLHGFQDRILVRRRENQADAHAKGQQVAHRDGPIRGHSIVERAVETLQDFAGGEFGEEP